MAAYLGFDIGGTKVLGVLTDAEGRVLAQDQQPTDTRGGDDLVAQIAAMAESLAPEGVMAIGLGVPAAVCPKTQSLSLIPNIDKMEGRLFYEALTDQFDLPIALENDVNCAALAEAQFAGEEDPLAFIAIGTGIGMGLVVNGRILRGRAGAAGEIAVLPIGGDPTAAVQLGTGALEEALGGAGWRRAYHQAGGRKGVSLAELFAQDDPLFEEVLATQADYLAQAILSISGVVAPEVFVLGGSIGGQDRLRAATQIALDAYFVDPPKLRLSGLGAQAGAIGAALCGRGSIR